MQTILERLFCLVLTILTLVTSHAWSAEWPQYRGLNRDGISAETGIVKAWPAEGPKILWKAPVGDGYSGMAVVNSRLYTMDAKDGNEYTVCVDATTGKEIWRTRLDAVFTNDQGNGPRATPTVDGDALYSFGAQGMLAALATKDGKKIWEQDLKKTVAAKIPIWGVSSSPLIEGDLLILPVGGEANAVVAFNKKTGAIVWKTESDEPGYSSPIAADINGVRQIVIFSGTMLLSVSPADGKVFWKYPWKTDWFVNAATPIILPDNKI
ncbi:MAG TPA: PQQ-binding-like beta-propeller repeat protein, partial [Acidobacteriota bacterium]